MSTSSYDERLSVPLRWWVQGVMFLATLWLAVVLWVPPALAWTITAVMVIVFTLGMLAYGAARVTLAEGRLRAGGARIETRFLGTAEPLDAEEAWRVAGPQADARAFLLLRPYLKTAVRIEITDPADPTPYWLLSTRHPKALADAVNRAVQDA